MTVVFKVKLITDKFLGICPRRYADCMLLLTHYLIFVLITSVTNHCKMNSSLHPSLLWL